MIITLFQPPARNWLLIADQLDDPPTWGRFVPSISPNSQRARFDGAAKDAAGGAVKIQVRKDLLVRGLSVFEYDWNTLDDDILAHAMRVSESLDVELLMGAPTSSIASRRIAAC